MRLPLLILVPAALTLACAKQETPATDSAAAATAAAPALTEADLAGTWSGTAKAEGDTMTVHWTNVCGGGSCKLTLQETPGDTISSTYRIDGDSASGTSAPFNDKLANNLRVIDNWVARISGTTINGHGWSSLADKPDSVVNRYTFTGTKS